MSLSIIMQPDNMTELPLVVDISAHQSRGPSDESHSSCSRYLVGDHAMADGDEADEGEQVVPNVDMNEFDRDVFYGDKQWDSAAAAAATENACLSGTFLFMGLQKAVEMGSLPDVEDIHGTLEKSQI